MTPPTRTTLTLLSAGTLGMFVAAEFLIPPGEPLTHAALSGALLFFAATVAAYIYAQWNTVPETARDEDLRPAVDVYTLAAHETAVPAALLEGGAPLVAVVRDTEVLHPEFVQWLTPYFADHALAFVQTATEFRGTGAVADAFCAQETLVRSHASGKNALNAAPLRGSGALIARDALREAYCPGISFGELGLRLQALGYSSLFEPTPLVLAAAPQTLDAYWPLLLRRGRRAFALVLPALSTQGLPFAARLQYLADASLYAGIAAAAAGIVLTPLMLLVRGTGPAIVSSGAALPGLLLFAVCGAVAAYALGRSGARVAAPAALTFAGAYVAAYVAARQGSLKLALGLRQLQTIAQGGGSGGTSPAGTPARL